MQIEYEDAPHAEASTSTRPPPIDDVAGGDDEGQDGEDGTGQAEDRPQKKKRIIKSRQSLAEKQPGTTLFPMSRIKRIIKADKELDMMSSEATFLVAVATEYFIKHFMEEGYTKARLEKRRIVNYKDMANVVSRSEEFEFLRDVIPLPMSISEALERRKQKLATDQDHESSEEEQERPRPSTAGKAASPLLAGDHDDLPPLAPSTNPLFPNAIVKRPSNTHARAAVPQPTKAAAPPQPVTPRVHTGKNAPSTPHSLTTRSGRRSINPRDRDAESHSHSASAEAADPAAEPAATENSDADDAMNVD